MRRSTGLALSVLLFGLALLTASALSIAQDAKAPRVGVLVLGGGPELIEPIRGGLAQLGYIEGKNIVLEIRSAQGQLGRVKELLAELIGLDVNVLVTVGAVGALVARKATQKIPIVFTAVVDPIPRLVASLERPGGNVTGIIAYDSEQATRQFELLKEAIPNVSRVALLSDQDLPTTLPDGSPAEGRNGFERSYVMAARAVGLQPSLFFVKGPTDVEDAFSAMKKERADALVILETPATIFNAKRIGEAATLQKVPAMFPGGLSSAGGLITYGTTISDTLPRIPGYVDKILKGAKPGEIPIEVITRRELIFNLKTAREIEVTIPPGLLKRAERIVE